MEIINKGKVNRYYNLGEILKLDLPSSIKETFREGFGKKFYFKYKENCKIGTLCGLESNHRLSMLYYILEKDKRKMFVPTWKNLRRM